MAVIGGRGTLYLMYRCNVLDGMNTEMFDTRMEQLTLRVRMSMFAAKYHRTVCPWGMGWGFGTSHNHNSLIPMGHLHAAHL